MYNHILLEVYCQLSLDNCDKDVSLSKCPNKNLIPSYVCLSEKCPYATFTSCENTLCYIGKDSTADEVVSFGGEMVLPENSGSDDSLKLWKNISHDKIAEAYTQYMEKIKAKADSTPNID